MVWLWLVFAGTLIWAVTSVVDRYALSGRIKNRWFYLVLPGIMHVVGTLLVVPFVEITSLPMKIGLVSFGVGLIEVFTLYLFFTAVSLEEISRVAPIGTITTFFTLIAAWIILGDVLTSPEWAAFLLFVIGGFLLLFRKVDKKIQMSKALPPLLIAGITGAFMVVLLKIALNAADFWSVFLYSRFGLMSGSVALLLSPLRKGIVKEWRGISLKFKSVLLGNQVLAVFGHVFLFYAVKLTKPALVAAAQSVQPVFVFVIALIVGKMFPTAIKEDVSLKASITKGIGVLLIVAATIITALL